MKTKALKTRKQNIVKILLVTFLFIGSFPSVAQNISLNINVNSTPRETVRYVEVPSHSYYFYPEIEVYFDINSSVYVYFSGNTWVRTQYLPKRCRGYNIRNGQRFLIDYRGMKPYTHFSQHKIKYKGKSYKKGKKIKKNKR